MQISLMLESIFKNAPQMFRTILLIDKIANNVYENVLPKDHLVLKQVLSQY